jgi:zinc protease
MGFLKDIEDMPNQYDYSLKFFDRYYRPEYTTIIVAGDVQPKTVRALVEKYWGGWKRGNYLPKIASEPQQDAPRTGRVEWPTATLPWIAIAYRAPAYSDKTKETAALDALAYLGFSENSDLYQKLVIQEQKVDMFGAENEDHVDPYLFTVLARVKNPKDVNYVRDQILETIKSFREQPVGKERLENVKKHLRYAFSQRLDNSETVAAIVARYVALRRTPETIDKIYEIYAQLTPADVRSAAGKYLVENGRTVVTLTGPAGGLQ